MLLSVSNFVVKVDNHHVYLEIVTFSSSTLQVSGRKVTHLLLSAQGEMTRTETRLSPPFLCFLLLSDCNRKTQFIFKCLLKFNWRIRQIELHRKLLLRSSSSPPCNTTSIYNYPIPFNEIIALQQYLPFYLLFFLQKHQLCPDILQERQSFYGRVFSRFWTLGMH